MCSVLQTSGEFDLSGQFTQHVKLEVNDRDKKVQSVHTGLRKHRTGFGLHLYISLRIVKRLQKKKKNNISNFNKAVRIDILTINILINYHININ